MQCTSSCALLTAKNLNRQSIFKRSQPILSPDVRSRSFIAHYSPPSHGLFGRRLLLLRLEHGRGRHRLVQPHHGRLEPLALRTPLARRPEDGVDDDEEDAEAQPEAAQLYVRESSLVIYIVTLGYEFPL